MSKTTHANENNKNTSQSSNSTELVKIMTTIAERGSAFKDIDDPSNWQREIRNDPALPGRNK